jgi:hypothetical protein
MTARISYAYLYRYGDSHALLFGDEIAFLLPISPVQRLLTMSSSLSVVWFSAGPAVPCTKTQALPTCAIVTV